MPPKWYMASYDRRKYYGPCLGRQRAERSIPDSDLGTRLRTFTTRSRSRCGKQRRQLRDRPGGGGFTNGSSNPNGNAAWHLETAGGTTFGGVTDTGTNLKSGFNTYGIDWVPGRSITYYVNSTEVGEITSAQTAIPSEPMEVIMNSSLANSSASGWHTSVDSSTPSTPASRSATSSSTNCPAAATP
jgi:hypothetical protein